MTIILLPKVNPIINLSCYDRDSASFFHLHCDVMVVTTWVKASISTVQWRPLGPSGWLAALSGCGMVVIVISLLHCYTPATHCENMRSMAGVRMCDAIASSCHRGNIRLLKDLKETFSDAWWWQADIFLLVSQLLRFILYCYQQRYPWPLTSWCFVRLKWTFILMS